MQAIKKAISLIIGLLILAGILFIVWYLIDALWKAFAGLPREVAATMITAGTTLVVAIITVVLGKYMERRLVVSKEMWDKKVPIYSELIDFLFELMANPGTVPEQKTNEFVKDFTKKMLVWGSDDVIVQWSKYKDIGGTASHDPYVVLNELEKVLLTIRKDIGHKNKKIKQGVLLSMFIKNDLNSTNTQNKDGD